LEILKVNQKVEVARRGEPEFYPALIQDVAGDAICITVPYLHGIPLILVPGDWVDVRVIECDATYHFTSMVLGRRRDKIPLYALSVPGEVKRVQRRHFVRLETLLEVRYAPLVDGDGEPVFRIARAIDISGGGMRLVTDQPLDVGDRLLLRFTLDLGERQLDFETLGRVVRRDEQEAAPVKTRYRYGIEFLGLSMHEQDQIVRYIFRRMAEQRKLR